MGRGGRGYRYSVILPVVEEGVRKAFGEIYGLAAKKTEKNEQFCDMVTRYVAEELARPKSKPDMPEGSEPKVMFDEGDDDVEGSG